LLQLTRLYERLARDAIEELDGARPNEPESIERNARQRELLTMLADGFARIAAALEALASDPNQPVLLGKAAEIVQEVSEQLAKWWNDNAQEAIGWAIKIPVFVASLPLLGWAGADMTYATIAMGAMVGGRDVATALANRRSGKSKRKK
jgi:hypothetical protein